MNLYEITGAMAAVQQMAEDGVPPEQLADQIELLDGDFKSKAGSILYVIANLKAEVEAVKAEENRLIARRKTRENSIARLKEYLLANMTAIDLKKVDNGIMTASIRKGVQVAQIDNEDSIPNEFKLIKTVVVTDKRELLKALKALPVGESIDGAQMVQGKNTLTLS